MPRSNRSDKIDPTLVQIIHTVSRTTRACRLLGDNPLTGENCDHRRGWIVKLITRFAGQFGIDVLSYSVLSNHHHQLLRSRPDVVASWSDTEVARRWLMICPVRKNKDGEPRPPTKSELDSIRKNPERLKEIRLRLSDVSWWMRLINQRVAQQANKEDDAKGRFFEDRFKGIPVIDEESVLACAAYVDLNWIRACMAETLELSEFTSVQRRIEVLQHFYEDLAEERREMRADSFLAPVNLHESSVVPGPQPSRSEYRCSDKGFLPMSAAEYIELLDWTARQLARGKPGRTPEDAPPIYERLGYTPEIWMELVRDFDELFITMAGLPVHIDAQRGKQPGRPFHVPARTRQLFAQAT